MFKDMTDAQLQESIVTLRSMLYVNAELRRTGGMRYMLRQLDIAVAVKRQRVRAGVWAA